MAIVNNITSEEAILSTCLNNLDQGWVGHVSRVGGDRPETLFSDPKNHAVFLVLAKLVSLGKAPNIPMVVDMLDAQHSALFPDGAIEHVSAIQLTPELYTTEQVNSVLDTLVDSRSVRRQLKGLELIKEDILDPSVDVSPSDVSERMHEIISEAEVDVEAQTFGDLAEEIMDSARPMWTQSTGIDELDAVLGGEGFESGTLTVIAARPKVGKTIMMNSMIWTTALAGNTPIVLNLETKKVEFMAKMIARQICNPHISWGKIKDYISNREKSNTTSNEALIIEDGIEWAKQQTWRTTFNKRISMQDIESMIMQVKSEIPEDGKIVLFIDYLQLQVTDSSRTVEQISDLTRFYKIIAGTYDIAVVLLSQLNRDAKDEKPKVYQMRGSGSIEQDADVVLLLHRPEGAGDNVLMVDGGTSRLSEGDEEIMLFIDGGSQSVGHLTEDMRTELDEDLIEGYAGAGKRENTPDY